GASTGGQRLACVFGAVKYVLEGDLLVELLQLRVVGSLLGGLQRFGERLHPVVLPPGRAAAGGAVPAFSFRAFAFAVCAFATAGAGTGRWRVGRSDDRAVFLSERVDGGTVRSEERRVGKEC